MPLLMITSIWRTQFVAPCSVTNWLQLVQLDRLRYKLCKQTLFNRALFSYFLVYSSPMRYGIVVTVRSFAWPPSSTDLSGRASLLGIHYKQRRPPADRTYALFKASHRRFTTECKINNEDVLQLYLHVDLVSDWSTWFRLHSDGNVLSIQWTASMTAEDSPLESV